MCFEKLFKYRLKYNIDFKSGSETISMHHVGLVYEVLDYNDSNLLNTVNKEYSGGAKWLNIDQLKKDMLSPFSFNVVKKIKS